VHCIENKLLFAYEQLFQTLNHIIMYDALKELDGITLNFSKEGLFVLNIILATIMFGVALEIKVKHFQLLFKEKKSTITGFVSQFIVLPFVTFILVITLNKFITPTIAMGMILVACCPGGNISNFISALAKGNAALSVTLTAIATLSAIILTPLNFSIWGSLYLKVMSSFAPAELLQELRINPAEMFKTVSLILGIPLVCGMLFNHYFPVITSKIFKPVRTISIILFFAIVIVMLRNNIDSFLHYIYFIFFIVFLHNALGLISGYVFSSAMKCEIINRRTISIETGIQNSGLALILLFDPGIFPPDLKNGGMAFIAAWWGIWHILSGLSIAFWWSRKPIKT
jgi:bile acid:Na+ symporter, BASS family